MWSCKRLKGGIMGSKYEGYFVIDKGSYAEIIRNDKSMFCCPYCKEWFKGLAYHVSRKHGVRAKAFRKFFGLKYNYQLTTNEIKERHREIVMQHKDSHIKRNLLIKGKKTRYKDGSKGHTKDKWSNQAIEEIKARGKKQFKNLWSGKK